MMKASLTTLIFLLAASTEILLAQKLPVKWGAISPDEMKMTVYPKDTSAAAVYLFRYGKSSINYKQGEGFYLEHEYHARLKILKKSAYDEANQSIYLYHSGQRTEKILSRKMATFNLVNGRITESRSDDKDDFKERFTRNIDVVKFTLPDVKEGSILEVAYKTRSPFFFNFEGWDFQTSYPTVISQYIAVIPEYFVYQRYVTGRLQFPPSEQKQFTEIIQLTTQSDSDQVPYNAMEEKWTLRDVPAFVPEPMMSNLADHISRIRFELSHTSTPWDGVTQYMGTWESVANSLIHDDYLGNAVATADFIRGDVAGILAGEKEPLAMARKLTNAVKGMVEWDRTYDYEITTTMRDVLKKKKGSSGDINLLLTAMLQQSGLTAYPIVLSTRGHGSIQVGYPQARQFNNVIAGVIIGDKTYLLDATQKIVPVTMIPSECMNGNGLMLSPNPNWVSLESDMKSRKSSKFDLQIDAEGTLRGTLDITADGFEGVSIRSKMAEKVDNYLPELKQESNWEISKSNIKAGNPDEPSVESYELVVKGNSQVAQDFIYVNPIIDNRVTKQLSNEAERKYPLTINWQREWLTMGKISIPAGYTVVELPKPRVLAMPGSAAKMTYSVTQVGNSIQISCQLVINKLNWLPSEYPLLRQFYEQVIAKQSEQIVLKRN